MSDLAPEPAEPDGAVVLHVVHDHPALGGSGGTERYVRALAQATGAPVLARDRRPGVPTGLRRDPGGLWALVSPSEPGFEGSWRLPAAEAALLRVMQAEGAALVHFHHLAHLDLRLPRTAREAGAAVVVTLHDYHLPCARGQLVDRDGARCPGPAPERCGRCLTEHLSAPRALSPLAAVVRRLGLEGPARAALSGRPLSARARGRMEARLSASRQALAAAHRVLSPSQDLARRVEALGWARAVHVQDLPLVSPIAPAPPPGEGPLRLLFVGGLIPTKGAHVLLEAFRRLPPGQASLSAYGPPLPFDGAPGYAEGLIEALRATPGARYGGVFGDRDRDRVYGGADLLVVPSLWEENSPLVVREARAAGLRVLGSAVGGIREIDPEARLAAPGDVEALEQALRAELAQGRGRRPPRDYPMQVHVSELRIHYEAAMKMRRQG
ncbi:MAG: glycosyltransferase [Alphaproteobacteria bacterium]|nr:glycosyltransferase [Alphaproteobacteria bacterium]MCB9792633.1 glycosyltransferase [Alphaproteobacteria bacterium]